MHDVETKGRSKRSRYCSILRNIKPFEPNGLSELLYLSKFCDMPNNPNTEAPITSFTLNELIALSGEAQYREGLLNGCIAVNSSSQMQLFRFPCRIDAFIIGVGTEGEAKGSLNLHEYCLRKDSLFVFGPKTSSRLMKRARRATSSATC